MLADGSITLGKEDTTRYQIAIELSVKDKDQLIKFCKVVGLNPNKIGERYKGIEGEIYRMAFLQFTCKDMVQDLADLGYFDYKAGSILNSLYRFPSHLQKTIILGIFDGDGIQGKSMLCITNINFLNQLKEYYNIKYNIFKKIDIDKEYINNNPVKPRKNIYSLSFGATFFNGLLDNYPSSMDRKRIYLDNYRETYDNLKKIIGTKEKLRELVNTTPKSLLAKLYGVNVKTLHKLCVEWMVKSPNHRRLEGLEDALQKFKLFREEL